MIKNLHQYKSSRIYFVAGIGFHKLNCFKSIVETDSPFSILVAFFLEIKGPEKCEDSNIMT